MLAMWIKSPPKWPASAIILCFLMYIRTVSTIGFDGIPGDYCRIRTPEKCCTSRNDECTMPILNNHLCYCDLFCREHPGNDCCPDFADVCEGRVTTATDRPFPDRTTTPKSDIVEPGDTDCVDNAGRTYNPGEKYRYNCNECVCGEGCDTTACVIQTDLLKQVNEGQYSWMADNYTDFWGQTLANGVKYRLGTLFPDNTVSQMNEILIEVEPNLPEQFDAREKWPSYIHPVRDQQNCGSSWAFSTTSVSADRLAIQSDGKFNAVLSPQQLISCNQFKQKGCDGGYLDRAWWYIRKLGVASEECYPYQSGRTNQPGLCSIPTSQYRRGETIVCPSGSSDNRIFKMTPPYRISTKEEDIMTEIFINGPVQATFEVPEDFFMYKKGVYQHLDLARSKGPQYRTSGSYHSVRVIGWGVDRSTGTPLKYWLCDNSWGTQWGENGYFRIIRGENHQEIESFVLGAWGKGSKRRRRFLVRKVKRLRLR